MHKRSVQWDFIDGQTFVYTAHFAPSGRRDDQASIHRSGVRRNAAAPRARGRHRTHTVDVVAAVPTPHRSIERCIASSITTSPRPNYRPGARAIELTHCPAPQHPCRAVRRRLPAAAAHAVPPLPIARARGRVGGSIGAALRCAVCPPGAVWPCACLPAGGIYYACQPSPPG